MLEERLRCRYAPAIRECSDDTPAFPSGGREGEAPSNEPTSEHIDDERGRDRR